MRRAACAEKGKTFLHYHACTHHPLPALQLFCMLPHCMTPPTSHCIFGAGGWDQVQACCVAHGRHGFPTLRAPTPTLLPFYQATVAFWIVSWSQSPVWFPAPGARAQNKTGKHAARACLSILYNTHYPLLSPRQARDAALPLPVRWLGSTFSFSFPFHFCGWF